MSILAGIVCRARGAPLPDSTCDALRRAISRDPRDAVSEYRNERAFLAKVDLNAFGTPAFLVGPDGSVSLLAGEPLLVTGEGQPARSRAADLELLHQAWERGDRSVLASATGVFCAVHYHPDSRLTLVADKLGVRPLYYWIGDDYLIFATALRILESLSELPKRMDVRAVTEMACLGFPLADRTPYDGVRALRAAEIVHVSETSVTRLQYWRWDEIQPSDQPEGELLKRAYDRFTAAVARRLGADTATTAFLSGGLDSRCVVAALRSRGAGVHTFNFGLPGTQDRVFSAGFARAAGAHHHQGTMKPEVELRFSMMLAEALGGREHRLEPLPERPRVVWCGEGGSVGVGHVYQSRAMVDLFRAGERDAAIDAFLTQQGAAVVRKLLQPSIAARMETAPKQGMQEELANLRCVDPGRALHLFLLLNDQHRHLAGHFEDIDLHRLELQAPFYDSELLQVMLETPMDVCLYHEFYVKWLGLFPPAVTAVPWQSYPGHVPCPLPIPPGLHYQWNAVLLKDFRKPRERELRRRAREMLQAERFPDDLLRKDALRLATWIHRARLRDYGYVIRYASVYHTYWSRCCGEWVAAP